MLATIRRPAAPPAPDAAALIDDPLGSTIGAGTRRGPLDGGAGIRRGPLDGGAGTRRGPLDGGADGALDPVRAHEAALIASSRGDHRMAEELLRELRQAGRGGIATDLTLASIEVAGPGRTDRGRSRFAAIAATPGHAAAHRAAAAEGRAVALLTGDGDAERARRVARTAKLAYPEDVAGVRAGALAACLDVLLGDVEDGIEAAAELPDLGDLELAHVVGTAQALARAVAGDVEVAATCLAWSRSGHPDPAADAADVTDRADVLGVVGGVEVQEHRLPPWVAFVRGYTATVLEVGRGDVSTAWARAAVARELEERRGRGALVAWWHSATAHLAIVAGDLAEAERSAICAGSAAAPHDPWGIGPISRCQLVLIAAQRGAVHLADARLEHLDAGGLGAHRPWLEVERCRALAWNEFAGGRPGSAAKLAVEAGEVALTLGRPLDASVAFGDVVRFGYPDLALPGAERAEAACSAPLPGLLASFARAAATEDVAGLRRAGDALLAAGLRPLAAEAWLLAARLLVARGSDANATGVAQTADRLLVGQDSDANATGVAQAADRMRRRAGAVLGSTAVVPITVERVLGAGPDGPNPQVTAATDPR